MTTWKNEHRLPFSNWTTVRNCQWTKSQPKCFQEKNWRRIERKPPECTTFFNQSFLLLLAEKYSSRFTKSNQKPSLTWLMRDAASAWRTASSMHPETQPWLCGESQEATKAAQLAQTPSTTPLSPIAGAAFATRSGFLSPDDAFSGAVVRFPALVLCDDASGDSSWCLTWASPIPQSRTRRRTGWFTLGFAAFLSGGIFVSASWTRRSELLFSGSRSVCLDSRLGFVAVRFGVSFTDFRVSDSLKWLVGSLVGEGVKYLWEG